MKTALIAYYNAGETPKVAHELGKLFSSGGFSPKLREIEPAVKMDLKKQFKKEKSLKLKGALGRINEFDVIVIGTPVVSFTSVPAVNVFIRALPKSPKTKVILYATGIGLAGMTIKKMQSLLSMKGFKVIDSQFFSSIFEFDSRKLLEVGKFFERFSKSI